MKIAAPATAVRAPAVMSMSVARPAFFIPRAGELVSAGVERKIVGAGLELLQQFSHRRG